MRAAQYFGLVSEDRYADEQWADDELTADVPAAEQHRSSSRGSTESGRAASGSEVTDLSSRLPHRSEPSATTSRATATREADMTRIITVHPRTYNEARTIGEHFRDGVPVIMNLSEMEDVDAKRLVDFAAGLIFGLHGTIERVTSKVFLLSPPNVDVTAEDKERIVGGFYNQS